MTIKPFPPRAGTMSPARQKLHRELLLVADIVGAADATVLESQIRKLRAVVTEVKFEKWAKPAPNVSHT
jgi:hypothetical protein